MAEDRVFYSSEGKELMPPIEPKKCTRCSTDNGAYTYKYFYQECGCLDVLYSDGGICYEHNHVTCFPDSVIYTPPIHSGFYETVFSDNGIVSGINVKTEDAEDTTLWQDIRRANWKDPGQWKHFFQVLVCRVMYGKSCPHINIGLRDVSL